MRFKTFIFVVAAVAVGVVAASIGAAAVNKFANGSN